MAVKKFGTVRSAFHAAVPVADLDTAYVVVPAAKDRQYTILDGWVRATGNFGNANATIGDGTTTAVAFTLAGMADGVILRFGKATTAVGTNMLTALLVNKPIVFVTSALETTATALDIYVEYGVSAVEETA